VGFLDLSMARYLKRTFALTIHIEQLKMKKKMLRVMSQLLPDGHLAESTPTVIFFF